MIDGLSMNDIGLTMSQLTELCPNLVFEKDDSRIDEKTKVNIKRTAKYRGLTFEAWGEKAKVSVRGSLWKFHHGNNYEPFTFSQVNEAVHELITLFPFLKDCVINSLEWGPNVFLDIDPRKFVRTYFVKYLNYTFSKMKNQDGESIGYLCEGAGHFYWKVYSKSLQCGLEGNLMRCELAAVRMQGITNQLGCKLKFAHLKDREVWATLQNLFRSHYEKILKIGDEDTRGMTDRQRTYYYIRCKGSYWENLHEECKRKDNDIQQKKKNEAYKYQSNRFGKFLAKHNNGNLHDETWGLIDGEMGYLLNDNRPESHEKIRIKPQTSFNRCPKSARGKIDEVTEKYPELTGVEVTEKCPELTGVEVNEVAEKYPELTRGKISEKCPELTVINDSVNSGHTAPTEKSGNCCLECRCTISVFARTCGPRCRMRLFRRLQSGQLVVFPDNRINKLIIKKHEINKPNSENQPSY